MAEALKKIPVSRNRIYMCDGDGFYCENRAMVALIKKSDESQVARYCPNCWNKLEPWQARNKRVEFAYA